jgi:hypothetical protein
MRIFPCKHFFHTCKWFLNAVKSYDVGLPVLAYFPSEGKLYCRILSLLKIHRLGRVWIRDPWVQWTARQPLHQATINNFSYHELVSISHVWIVFVFVLLRRETEYAEVQWHVVHCKFYEWISFTWFERYWTWRLFNPESSLNNRPDETWSVGGVHIKQSVCCYQGRWSTICQYISHFQEPCRGIEYWNLLFPVIDSAWSWNAVLMYNATYNNYTPRPANKCPLPVCYSKVMRASLYFTTHPSDLVLSPNISFDFKIYVP